MALLRRLEYEHRYKKDAQSHDGKARSQQSPILFVPSFCV